MVKVEIQSKRDVRRLIKEEVAKLEISADLYKKFDRLRTKIIDLEKIMENWNSKIKTGKNKT